MDKFIFTDNIDVFSEWYIINYIKYIENKWVWQFVGLLGLIVLVLLWRSYFIKKLNKDLHSKIEQAIEEAQKKDRILYQQSKLVSMGEMIEVIAHQWRQPLSEINSSVLVLDSILDSKNIDDPKVEDSLLEIESLTDYMSKTIDEFQDFYAPDKEKKYFTYNSIINNAISIVNANLISNNIELSLNLKDEVKLYGYSNELKEVLIIVLNNAIDAFKQKSVSFAKISLLLQKRDNTCVLLVSDNAGGVAKEYQNRIFEPYFTTKNKEHGRGIGLYIAKIIIEDSMEGSLRQYNTEDGATFEIILGVRNE